MPTSNLHLDILMGRDETIDYEDFLNGKEHVYFLGVNTHFFFSRSQFINRICGFTHKHGTQAQVVNQ
jgi:hypothetical protein